ncbi:flavin reductase family protein [Luteimonas sp. 3794]|uniref:flavin reductase family protein n=1 Tax=Luteimonas sp. 3794 TaxID=2817730 RepID=UPI00285AD317|nr:flavin reductase family protein [Luteimonas sp. 3794]MDR6991662.1 flavin reductase (DIM6/NTAB) family NADH-FMN oxidoreductase RutF [Luteimonas sp. 3794]
MPRTHAIPPDQTRRYLEPGPVVLLSTAHRGERGIMTLGWHMMLGYDLVGTYIDPGNRSHALARASRACVINLPTADLLDTVVRIGNCSSADADKFAQFGLSAVDGDAIDAPGIGECHARFECRLHETRLTAEYPLFVWRVVAAHAAKRPRWPRTLHYRGNGQFMVSGDARSRRALFKPGMLDA